MEVAVAGIKKSYFAVLKCIGRSSVGQNFLVHCSSFFIKMQFKKHLNLVSVKDRGHPTG